LGPLSSLGHLPVIVSITIAAVLDGLEKMVFFNSIRGCKIGYCPRQAESRMASTGRKVELFHRTSEGRGHRRLERAEASNGACGDSRVPIEAQAAVALALKQDSPLYPSPDASGGFAWRPHQIANVGRPQGNTDIDAVEKRASKSLPIMVDFLEGAEAGPTLSAEVPAGTGVGSDNKLKIGGKADRPAGPGNRHSALFERLPQRLERIPVEFGRLVDKENALMREACLAGPQRAPAPHEALAGS
jgi:hypothetical protein